MTRFTDEERDRIRADLHRAGRELFTRFGLDRTRIADLTDDVGIGTSTFYQFFDSKEALYLSILARERARVEEELDGLLADTTDIRTEVRTSIEHFLEELTTNPLYYRLLIEDEMATIRESVDDDVLAAHHRAELSAGGDRLDRWVDHEAFRVDDTERLQAMFRLLGFTIAARSELFEPTNAVELYESAQSLLVDVVVDGLLVDEP